MNLSQKVQIAIKNYQSGSLENAKQLLHEILKEKPNDAEILYFLGIVYAQAEDFDQAMEYIQKSLQFNKTNSDAYLALGIMYKQKGIINNAITAFEKAISLNPNDTEAYNNLGDIWGQKGQLKEAIACYENAIKNNPNNYELNHKLGMVYEARGLFNEAIISYQKAIQINPNSAEAYNNLGNVLSKKGCSTDAIACYQKAIQINPKLAEIYYNLGKEQELQGNQSEAMDAFDMAIKVNPKYVTARWAKCMSQLPILYQDQSHIEIARKDYYHELVKLTKTISLESPQDIKAAVEAIGCHQPFYLACQSYNNRELQELYGTFVCKIMGLQYPHFAICPSMPSISSTKDAFRIGIVSKYFYWHSIWKIPLRGWIENLDKERFSICSYHIGISKDRVTEIVKNHCKRFVEDVFSFEELCQIIRDDKLHVLIYPAIGMDSVTLRLASLRLAPVQCTTLGHPDTSGLPTIDYYLSSDLMEPPDADEHYTEKLIRLPNLGFSYEPFDVTPLKMSREDFGLHPKSILYFCSHALFTHLPQYDDVYPLIAKQVNDCYFIFLFHISDGITEKFYQRIKKSFYKYNMNAGNYVIILPRLDQTQYHFFNHISDIFLDTIGWSANNSTFEALACNLPVVTLPGTLMRQRHCAGILQKMGLTETIASSLDDYISIAVRLGKDSEWRREISEKIASNKYRIYRDKTCITALEDFLEKVIKEKL